MMELFPWLLFLHVLAAIVAFGPTFAFSIIGAMGGAEPQHANFGTRVSLRISDILVLPFALSLPVTGALMIWVAEIPLFDASVRWLLLAIVLYALALGLSLFVSRPNVHRIIAFTGGTGGQPPGDAPAGPPPPQLMGAIRTVQRTGMALSVLVVSIVFLMVIKPALGF